MFPSAHFTVRGSRFSLSLALVAGAVYGDVPAPARGSGIPAQVSYGTSGTIASTGVTGAPRVEFEAASGSVASASPFSLGSFEVEQPTTSSSFTRYSQTPVTISYWTRAINGESTSARDGTPAQPMVIRGWLSGTVGGSTPSALSVVFDQGLQPDDPRFYQPRPLPPFPNGSIVGDGKGSVSPPGFLSLNGGQSLLALNPTLGASTPVQGQVDLASSVPEPPSLVIFLAMGLGFAMALRYRRV